MRKRIISALLAFFIAFGILAVFHTDVDAATKYSIKVNYRANVVTIYKSGKPYKAMLCSTGSATPKKGTYKLSYRYRWHGLKGGVKGQYCVVITGNIWFHSVPYSSQSVSKLKKNEYDKLGTSCSMGCVRLSVKDAKWIYDNCKKGTPVTFYASENPGPLGKPEGYKINGAPPYYIGWDPTDPNKNNPWRRETYYTQNTFRADKYLKFNPELRQIVGTDSLRLKIHWLTKGVYEGKRGANEFDVMFVRWMYPEIAAREGSNAAIAKYYNTTGKKAGMIGSELNTKFKVVFDSAYYAKNNPEIKASYGTDTTTLWKHYQEVGVAGNVQSSPVFSVSYYKQANPDLAAIYGDDMYGYISHFINKGMAEGRVASENFDVKAYKEEHPELAKKFGNNYAKYYQYYIEHYK